VPIARYVIFVGGTLATLLFIPGWLLPKPPAMFPDQSAVVMDPQTAQSSVRYHLTKRQTNRILRLWLS
jgi:hypothetical protein